jgi:glutamyl-tRNA reductase
MALLMLGVSHKNAPVEVREALALDNKFEAAYAELRRGPVDELVLLSTCNRVEAYAWTSQPHEAEGLLRAFFEKLAGGRLAQTRKALTLLHDDDMLWHLLQVSASLDSLVLGEAQILGQVKVAYEKAVEAKAVGPHFHGLFQRVFAAAKEVRHKTEIGQHPASVPSIAVQLAERLFGQLEGRCALVLGAGEMAELTATVLKDAGVSRLLFCNRSIARAKELARRFGGEAHTLDAMAGCLAAADVVLCSTGAPDYVLTYELAAEALKQRQLRPQLFIDMAVPRNIDPAAGELENAYLYNLDDLGQLAEEHRERRVAASRNAEFLLKARLAELKDWMAGAKVVPTVARLSQRFEAQRAAEWERMAPKLRHLDPKDLEKFEAFSKALTQKLLHTPVQRLKSSAAKGSKSAELVDSLETLFDLKDKP